ncbi:prephenate dehydrogenase [Tumebacillus flagellatus]|uniref:Prephenate dehydrogenase n=1 Tax=Tumebacillus flagellatus TaxID=1157490 RepID=A0A074LNM6_9BACL|nr:prephenate dehydrogenase [Tumebacillus flagellatus]KEO83756.1 prephenate dehydrogenase [Tumebacillus flagellatus]
MRPAVQKAKAEEAPLFAKGVIIGCGLIGGSLALALRENGAVQHLAAVDSNPSSCELAVELGVVDAAYSTLREAVTDADLIVFAAPVRQTCELLAKLAALPLKPGCIVTDVCSTKAEVCAQAARLLPSGVHFIGGHPMAGSEKSGVKAANARLFENAVYVLTPPEGTDADAFAKLVQAIESVKAQVLVLEPAVHDRVVAAISHVPHIIAAQLVDQVMRLSGHPEHGGLYTKLAAGGFRDVTRIASGNAQMWRDIVLSNRDVIRELLVDWQVGVADLLAKLDESEGGGLQSFFHEAAAFRDALPTKLRGAVRSVYEISIDAPDEPGVIGKVATLMGIHGINLNGVGLIESREEDNGQVLLSYRSKRDMEQGAHVLLINGFQVYFRD